MDLDADIVIVGGGIGGMSAASALARDGHRVTVLEASFEYEDRLDPRMPRPRRSMVTSTTFSSPRHSNLPDEAHTV